MQQFQFEGLWWSPDQPEDQWVGRLSFHQRDGITLSIIQPLSSVPSFSFGGGRSEAYGLLHGRTTDGKAISIFHCYETSSKMSISGEGSSRTRTLGANSLIVGLHARTADLLVSTATLSVRHLSEWWGRSGLEMDPTVERPNSVVRYTAPAPLVLCDDGDLRVSLRSGVSGRVGNGKATLEESVTFEIEAAVPKPLSELQRRIRACTDFLSIACLTLCEIDELELEQPESADQPTQRGTFHAVPIYRSRERGSVIVHMLFRGGEVRERLPELFNAWCSRAEALHDVRALYIAGAYGGGFIEGKLQSLTQAAEAFHRRFRAGSYMNEEQFQRDVLAPVLAAIPQETDDRLRQSMIARLRYANGFSQRQRFKGLFREYAAGLETLATKPTEYVDPIVDHRNEFTHFDPDQRTTPLDVPPERVLLYNFLLRMLLEACFLESMGFTKDEVVALLRRSETYRQLSARFRPWAINTTPRVPPTEGSSAGTEAPVAAATESPGER
jgi:hypothetical protein